jgi:hypothetical protein
VVTQLGAIAGTGQVVLDYSFDRLGIAGGGNLYYWSGSALSQVTDPDLGTVVDIVWVDGYFMSTDGTSLIVTELNDPMAVNPLKYGSSEADPDPVKALHKVRNEVYALNRHTVEVFTNVGGSFFPFERVEGAQIQKGAVGTHLACVFVDVLAFVGGGRNESLGVYLGANGNAQKISTDEIDRILAGYTEAQVAGGLLESRISDGRNTLYLHLPDRTLAYDATASAALSQPVWYVLTTAVSGFAQYKARNFVLFNGKWVTGDPSSAKLGTMTVNHGKAYGSNVRWEFGTQILYNAGSGAIVHRLELVALTGKADSGARISTSFSTDGVTWSDDRSTSAGSPGDLQKRIVWLQQGYMRNWRIQRFQSNSMSHVSFARLEAQLEPMAW